MLSVRIGLLLMSVACFAQGQGQDQQMEPHPMCQGLPDNTGILTNTYGATCEHFLQCDNGQLLQRLCSGNAVFNPDTRNCSLHLSDVDCDQLGPYSQESSDDCIPGRINNDCYRYRECGANPAEKECGLGTVYSQAVNVCVLPGDKFAPENC